MKFKLTSTWLAAVAGLASVAAAASTALMPANQTGVAYEGRYAIDAAGAIRLGFPGVTAHLHFRGKDLVLHANAEKEGTGLDVAVDGAAPTLLALHEGAHEYPLLSGATAAEHNVVLTRRNESWQGTIDLLGFDLAGGEWLAAPVLPARKLMFIGDSITCGEMTAFAPGQEMHRNSDARLSYGMILARRFGAQCHLVSYGGRGVIRDWQGIRDTNNAPQFYELALPDDPATKWDPARYVPDAIGIGLGTNDFNQGVPDQNEFVNAYVEFIRKIQRDAPSALIFVMDSPIVDDNATKGPRRTVLHAYLEQIVARVRSPLVILAPVSHYPGVPGNGHPTGAEHEAMAAELAPVLQRALGW
jgi:hypothetical protein